MAKSIQYKNVYPNNTSTLSKVKNITGDLKSKANNYTNNINLSKVKSTAEEKAGDYLDDAKTKIEQYTGKLPI